MHPLDIDQLIHIAKHDPAEFEARRSLLLQEAIQSSGKPEVARQLQSAVSRFHGDPAGDGADTLQAALAAIHEGLVARLTACRPAATTAGRAAQQQGLRTEENLEGTMHE